MQAVGLSGHSESLSVEDLVAFLSAQAGPRADYAKGLTAQYDLTRHLHPQFL